jgi:monovalent cation/proton antiporter MnhG/PhaG subunit
VSARQIVAEVLVTVGVAAELICVLGVCWLRDVFDKLHFAAASSTLGPLLIGAAVIAAGFSSISATLECVVAMLLLIALNPALTHVTARLAWRGRAEDGGAERFTDAEASP